MKVYIDKYRAHICKGRYFDAHEALEEYWFPRRKEKNEFVLIVKGFINAAVSLELKKRGRLEASKRTWKTYEKLTKYLEVYPNDELEELKIFINRHKIDN